MMMARVMQLADADFEATPPPAEPRPAGWIMHMRWTELLFMHWPVAAESLRPFVPTGLEIDLFEGRAWLGIVPFRMSNVRARGLPPIPPVSAFPELNVRTYVSHNGKPGVWFFSLDAASRLAVWGARRFWNLLYFNAEMSVILREGQVHYRSTRTHKNAPPAALDMTYHPTGPAVYARPGTLADFYTNRLCLFSASRSGTIYRGDIHHAPWPLRPADAEIRMNTMTAQLNLALPEIKPTLHYVDRLDVVAWRIVDAEPHSGQRSGVALRS